MRFRFLTAGLIFMVSSGSSPGQPPGGVKVGDSVVTEYSDSSLPLNPQEAQKQVLEVQNMAFKIVERWNAHDLPGFISFYWNSPNFVEVNDEGIHRGWAEVSAEYERGFPDRNEMGNMQYESVNIQLLQPGIALTVTNWTIRFKFRNVTGIGTEIWRKFLDGWKIVSSHDTYTSP
jgi:ketosteroid isomerase-like protein